MCGLSRHHVPIVSLVFVLLVAPALQAAILTVGAAGDHTTLQAAIAAADEGDTIRVVDAVHTEQGITVNKNITIEGLGASQTIVQAHADEDAATNRVFNIAPGKTVTIRDMTIRHGKVVGDSARGGGIDNLGSLSLIQVVVTRNRIVSTDFTTAYGGGIYNAGILNVIRCTISANQASGATIDEDGRGAGIANVGGLANITNSTLCDNAADGAGGAVYEADSGTTLAYCTVSHNFAGQGGGLASGYSLEGHGLHIRNTIVSDNVASSTCCADIDGRINSLGYNLIRDASTVNGCLDTTYGSNTDVGNIIGVDPLLGPLTDNGGPTPTRAIPANSPAADQIPDGTGGAGIDPLHMDQRGVPRPQRGASDIGAYEFVPVAPTVTTTAVVNVTASSADGGGEVTTDGGEAVTARGVCWNTTGEPTVADNKTFDGTGPGPFSSRVTGLSPGTTYYVRAYATNSVGTSYGDEVTFTTPAVAPTVTTTAVVNVTASSADGGGEVTTDGGEAVTARGVCWNTTGEPTVADNKTSDGTGLGSFSSSITGLSPGMTYYVRAYATNSAGTGYGKVVTFTTPADPGEPEPPNDPQDPDSDPPTDPQDPDPDLQERDPDPQDSDPDPPSPDDHATHPISDPQDEDDTQPPTCGWNTLFPWMLTFTGLGLMRSRWRR